MTDSLDYSLCEDSLAQWREWTGSLQQRELSLRVAIRVNKTVVAVSMPLWMLARIVGIPLMFIDMLTLRFFTLPLRVALIPLYGTVLRSSAAWDHAGVMKLALLIVGPSAVGLSMILISLIPQEPDIRDAKYIMCELWPLSHHRLQWIEEHGSGKSE